MRNPKFLFFFLILIVGFLSVAPTLTPIFQFDDPALFQFFKREVVGLSGVPLFLKQIWSGLQEEHLFRPIFMATVWVDANIFGSNALFAHAHNIAIHLVVLGLASLLFVEIWGLTFPAWMASLIFATHPVHIDAVAFIKNRSEMLSALFILLRILIYKRWGEKRSTFPLLALLWGLALGSKESAAAGLLVGVLYFFLFTSEKPKKMGLAILPFIFIGLLYASLRYVAIGNLVHTQDAFFGGDPVTSHHLADISVIFLKYIEVLVIPTNLRVDYFDFGLGRSWTNPSVLLSLGLHGLFFAIALLALKKKKMISFLIFGFYLSLLPVSHLFPFGDVMAERFLYLPSLFYCGAIGFFISKLPSPKSTLFLLVLPCIYGAISVSYGHHFRSDEDLWKTMVARAPQNAKFHYNLGVVESNAQDWIGASRSFENALSISPRMISPYLPLAQSYLHRRKVAEAERVLRKALALGPELAVTHRNYALFHYDFGDLKVALKEMEAALKIDPSNPELILQKKMILEKMKHP